MTTQVISTTAKPTGRWSWEFRGTEFQLMALLNDPRVAAAGLVPYRIPDTGGVLFHRHQLKPDDLGCGCSFESIPGQFAMYLEHPDPGAYDTLRPLLIQLQVEHIPESRDQVL